MPTSRRTRGFTLVECLVAMAIFAIMSLLLVMIFAAANRQYGVTNRIDRDTDSQGAAIEQGASAGTNGDQALTFQFDHGVGTVTVPGQYKKAGDTDDEVNIHYFVPELTTP